MTMRRYQAMKDLVTARKAEHNLPTQPTFEQYVDWTYGTTAIENRRMTHEIARTAVEHKFGGRDK